mgnify:CR=1 FL=1
MYANTLRIDSIHQKYKQVDTRSTAPQKDSPTPA